MYAEKAGKEVDITKLNINLYGLNWKYWIQWSRSNGSYSLHLLNANIWLPSGSFNLRKSSQISQSHSNPSFSLMISWHNYFVCVTWTVGHSSRCRTIYPAAQRRHLEASSTSGSCHTEPTLDLELSFRKKTRVRLGNIQGIVQLQVHISSPSYFSKTYTFFIQGTQKEKLWKMWFTMDA